MQKLKYWLPTVAWMGVIFWFSSRPSIPTSDIYWQDFTLKKTAHFVEYATLAVLLYRSLKRTSQMSMVQIIWWTIIVCGVYAISDEFHQSLVPGREPHVRDISIDIVGSIAGALTAQKYVR